MIEVFSWYGIIWALGLLTLPLTFLIFGRLPDRGYAFSKPVGLLVVSLLAWWIGNLKLLPFTQTTCWLAVIAVGLVSNLVLLTNRRLGQDMVGWFGKRHNWNYVIAAELVFFLAYAFIINMRSFFPQLNQSEKFFDYGFINAIAASPELPPPDPWFGGLPMNYYYGGQLLMGVFSKLSGTEVSTGYNIAMGLVYALGAVGIYGLASNLVGLARGRGWVSIEGGIFGVTLVQVLGNLYPLRQVLQHFFSGTSDPNFFVAWGQQNFPFQIGWPASARMIYDPMPDGRMLDILTEYPIYSYLNGDLHAHLLGAPYVIVALGWLLNLFAANRKWGLARLHWREVGHFVAGGMVIGGLYFINGGDFPTYLLLTVVVLALVESRFKERWRDRLGRFALQLAAFGLAMWLVYLFYFVSFTGMIRGKPLEGVAANTVMGFLSRFVGWISWPRTNLSEYVQMFGLFFLPILTFMALKLLALARSEKIKDLPPVASFVGLATRLAGLILLVVGGLSLSHAFEDLAAKNITLQSLVLPLIAFTVAPWTLWPRAWQNLRSQPRLAIEGLAALTLLAVGSLLKFELLGPVVVLLYFAARLLLHDLKRLRRRDSWLTRLDSLLLVVVALASLITLFCELLYVRDIYANRFNTMFKFWYQLWVLFGLAGVYSAWRVVSWHRVLDVTVVEPTSTTIVTSPQPVTAARPGWLNSLTSRWSLLPTRQAATEAGVNLAFNQTTPATSAYPAPVSPAPVPLQERVIAPAQPDLNPPKISSGWRWAWLGLLAFLMFSASAVPVLAYWQTTNHYTNRQDLNGETWYAETFPTEYPAMRWLREYTRQDPARRGVVLEVNGMNYSWASRISVYTGLPTVIGWPFHELQWRGNLDELAVWQPWLDMTKIYETTDVEEAKTLLHKNHVRYVFVGQVENGTRSLFSDGHEFKKFSPEALAKFAGFMKTVYADPANNIYIYAFY